MATFTTNALLQVASSGSDWYQFKMILAEKDFSSYGLNTLGPLCLWQCFIFLLIDRKLKCTLRDPCFWHLLTSYSFPEQPIVIIIISLVEHCKSDTFFSGMILINSSQLVVWSKSKDISLFTAIPLRTVSKFLFLFAIRPYRSAPPAAAFPAATPGFSSFSISSGQGSICCHPCKN